MDDVQRLKSDLAMARRLAEEGRQAPLLGGVFLVVWGLMICACLLFNWGVASGLVAVSSWSIPIVWFGGMGVAHLLSRALAGRLAAAPGALSIGNTVASAVWRAMGLFLGLFAATLFASLFNAPGWMFGGTAADGGRIFGAAFSIFMPVSFGAYAVAMAATAAAARSTLLTWFGRLSLLVMVVMLLLIGRPEQMLLGAAGILLVSVLPGWLLMRRAPPAPHDRA
jgi:hypothetical protein